MTHDDVAYYTKREQQERNSAERSGDQGARRIHLEMAKRYATLTGKEPQELPVAS